MPQHLAMVWEDERKLAIIEGSIAAMDRHMVARAQEHHILNIILAPPADPVQMMTLAQRLLVQLHRLPPAERTMASYLS